MPHNIGPDLATLKGFAIATIDTGAGNARAQFLTAVTGQSATYMYKLQDCQRYIADGYPANITVYPWVDSESQAQNKSAKDAADFVVATYNAWKQIGIAIENARITGKNSVRAATDAAGVCTARDTAIAALDTIVTTYA